MSCLSSLGGGSIPPPFFRHNGSHPQAFFPTLSPYGPIFVVWDGMGLVAKRIEHVPHSDPSKVLIKSVNPEYAGYKRTAE